MRTAPATPWSSSIEEQVKRLNLFKRQSYGRAKLAPLRRRTKCGSAEMRRLLAVELLIGSVAPLPQ